MSEKREVALFSMACGLIYVSQASDYNEYNNNVRVSNIVTVEFDERDENEMMQAKVAAVELEIEQANNVLQKALQKKQELLALEHKE